MQCGAALVLIIHVRYEGPGAGSLIGMPLVPHVSGVLFFFDVNLSP